MAIPALVNHTGTLAGSPGSSSVPSPSLLELLNTSFSAAYGSMKGARPSILGATTVTPYQIPFETITKVRLFGMRIRSGHMQVQLSSALGLLQLLPVSDLLLIHSPFPGDELIAISLVGTADVEYVIAGDVS